MKSFLKSLVSHTFALALIVLPFQTGQASMIGIDQMDSTAGAQSERVLVNDMLSRAETVKAFEMMGLDSSAATERLAAMTDEEVRSLAGKINAAPAGADGGLALLVLVVFFIWFFAFRS